MMPYTIKLITAQPDFSLLIAWAAGGQTEVNITDIIQHTRGLAALREPAAFALAGVGEDGLSVAWSPELEISARRLWQLASEQSSDSRAEFRDWLQRNQLTLTTAAEALGLFTMTEARMSASQSR